ncbi:2Fe-2S iron-sulfur cluster-binding protein [Leucothrix arctica]|uniref:(2Fe-2S)-binding protein n=1 Tax=Leucothrix arctica TaxID=1481894 RepID=A0A317CCA5_9GAMM|nr:2Fe-2S iron-sulfur cluster-binding protein [Leucothrix arctica]PWQ96264.1 (2Fe-2S)-binding protein [Leucothrix arctica]
MALVFYVAFDGSQHEADVPVGSSVMDGAVNNGIDGILAECGGAMSCATCHVYIDDAWVSKVSAPTEMEQEMLEVVSNPKENSRLSCQVTITTEMEGLKVHLPESQF